MRAALRRERETEGQMTKKILFLGGTGAMYDVVEIAKRKGIYTIVVDYYENSPAKRIADKSYLESTTDVEKVLKIAEAEQIDGVFTGFSDANLLPARYVANRLKLPFYATEEQIEKTTSKLLFKEVCRAYKIPVVPQYPLTAAFREEDLKNVRYPVIVKPADSWASKGVSICGSEKELRAAVPHALRFSEKKEIIVERYMAEYADSCMYFNIQEGKLSLSCMCDRDMKPVRKGKAMQPNALFYPSAYLDLYYEQLQDKIQNMVSGLGMRDGTMFMQCFIVDGVIMPFEMGYRLCGASEYILCDAENGINSCGMLLDYALTGRFDGADAKEKNRPYFRHRDGILLILLRAGQIKKIEGLETIKADPRILKVLQFYYEGDRLGEETAGTLNQTFARIFIQAQDNNEMLEMIKFIQENLHVYDDSGRSMVIDGYDCAAGHLLKDGG